MRPAPMPYSVQDYAIWALSTLLLAVCLVLLRLRGRHRELPFFTLYLTVVLLTDLTAWWVYHTFARTSTEVFYYHWGVEAMLVPLKALVVAELCYRVLGPYPGVWGLARILLGALAVILAIVAAASAWGQAHWIAPLILAAKRGVGLAIVGVLAGLAAVCRIYDVPIRRTDALVALGLAAYLTIDAVNSTFHLRWIQSYFPLWAVIASGSYLLALGIWLAALARPAEAPAMAAGRLTPQEYGQLSPAVNERLRALNARLEEMLRG
jgi:hypothetical protein